MNYTTSKDYEALWNLVQGGKEIICYVPYSGSNKQVAIARMNFNEPIIFLPYGDWIHGGDEKAFITYCGIFNLEFIPPDEWIKINGEGDFRGMPDQDVNFIKDGKAHSGSIFQGMLTDMYEAVIGATHWKPMPEAPKE